MWAGYLLWYFLDRNDIAVGLRWSFLRGWSFDLFIFGAAIIFIAAIVFAKKVMIAVPVGYIIGLVLAVLFNTDTFDPNPETYVNNAWTIWTGVYLVFIAAGIVWEVLLAKKHLTPSF